MLLFTAPTINCNSISANNNSGMSTLAGVVFLFLVIFSILQPARCDVTGTDPVVGSCLCATKSTVDYSDAACGNVLGTINENECYRYTAVHVECLRDEELVEYFRVDYGNTRVWLPAEHLRSEPETSCPTNIDERQVIIIGDWGEIRLSGQALVADAMGNFSLVNHPAWIISTGDNFYPIGISSWNDSQVDIKWRDVYTQPTVRDLVWKISVGNHDFGEGRGWEWNQVELTNHEPRWYFPHPWHDFVETVGDHTVHFVVIDTESYRDELNNATTLLPAWMEETLSQSSADWKLVVGHRPIFSSGNYGPASGSHLEWLVPILERNNVDAYICGHDHNLQHIRNISGQGIDYVINGAGGAGIYLHDPESERILEEVYAMDTLFFEATWGFIGLTTRQNELIFDYYNQDNMFLYSFTRTRQAQQLS